MLAICYPLTSPFFLPFTIIFLSMLVQQLTKYPDVEAIPRCDYLYLIFFLIWKWSLILGTMLRSSERATSGLNHWAPSSFPLSSFSHLMKLLTMMGIVMNVYSPNTWGLRQKDLQYEAEWHLCWHNLAAYIKVKPRTLRQVSVVLISIG